MCGIAGIYRFGVGPPTAAEQAEDRELLDRMLTAIEYRGPDDVGIESVGRLTFGARRLAILDVAGGHQPLSDAAGMVWATLNGEIYNFPALRLELEARHQFRTRTDTELLPYLYLERGSGAIEALRGMFACAIYDVRSERLLVARDPLGIKPLYFARIGDRLLYASELKALLCDPTLPREIDLEAFGRYLALGFVPGEATIIRSVRKLRPGCVMEVEPRSERRTRYWTWPRFFAGAPTSQDSFENIVAESEQRITEAASMMLLSDVPLGVLLSGGIDSSVLVALLPPEVRHEMRTYTIGFAGAGHHDERIPARRVAAHLGTHHHELVVPLDVASELPRVIRYLDEPCADAAVVPAHVVARAASAEVKVLLSGTGGDEVFGGYRRHHLGRLLSWLRWLPRPLAGRAAARLGDLNLHRRSLATERLIWLRKLLEARSRTSFFESYLSTMQPAAPAVWAPALAVPTDPARIAGILWKELLNELGEAPTGQEALAFTADHLFHLPDALLLKEDRATMGASVEGRVPYLDHRLVEFAAGLPIESRFHRHTGKRVLRAIAQRHLPAEIATRPKHGFTVPIESWLRGPLDELVGDLFAAGGSGLFEMAVLRQWHGEHRRGLDRSGPLWAALCLELWWRELGLTTATSRAGAAEAPSIPFREAA